jgi:hypothetical protein
MADQNFSNHSRIDRGYHMVTGIGLLALFAGSVRYLFTADDTSLYAASLLVLSSLILMSIFMYARAFALKAQDRAIRAEENFRHYLLTGKPLDPRLKMGQIIALRFASDEELPALVTRALDEDLSKKEIKMSIRNWKADHYRV